MKTIHGSNIAETRDDLIVVTHGWDVDFEGDDEEMEINRAVREWAQESSPDDVAEFLRHSRVTMIAGYPTRMGIVRHLKSIKKI